jgi:hypothetical protein
MSVTLTEEPQVHNAVTAPNKVDPESILADGGPLDMSKEVELTDKPKTKPTSFIKAQKKQLVKKQTEAEMHLIIEQARDEVNPLVEAIGLAGKNTLENVIKIGEILNEVFVVKCKKAKMKDWLPKIGFKLSEQTARSYRGIATYKQGILQEQKELETEASKTSTVWTYSITDALKTAAAMKRMEKDATSRAKGKTPKPRKTKASPIVIKLIREEGHSVLMLDGAHVEVKAFYDLNLESMDQLNPNFVENMSIKE